MCFRASNTRKYIAKRDIKVYKEVTELFYNRKRIENECVSYFRSYRYTKNVTCEKVNLVLTYDDRIYKGYHSFINKSPFTNAIFIIPKGAEYYINRWRNERVSNTIKFIDGY